MSYELGTHVEINYARDVYVVRERRAENGRIWCAESAIPIRDVDRDVNHWRLPHEQLPITSHMHYARAEKIAEPMIAHLWKNRDA